MNRDFPPILARLIPRLGSSFDGEIIATAKAIERTLRSHGLEWHDIAGALAASPSQGKREGASLWCYLDSESRSFVNSVAAQIRSGFWLSPKQLGCIDKILAAAWQRGVRPDARRRA